MRNRYGFPELLPQAEIDRAFEEEKRRERRARLTGTARKVAAWLCLCGLAYVAGTVYGLTGGCLPC